MTLLVRIECRIFIVVYMVWLFVVKEMRFRRMAGSSMKFRLLVVGLEWNIFIFEWEERIVFEYVIVLLRWKVFGSMRG